jgi:hypothetical protein
VGLKLNGAHELLAYADDINLLGDNTDTINKNKETSIYASKEVGIEVNAKKMDICSCLISRVQVKIMTSRQLTDALRMWHSSNT